MDEVDAGLPRCFESSLQWRLWRELAKMTEAPVRQGYCIDCLPDYKRQMLSEQRCAHPTTTFHVDSDGFTEGRRPTPNQQGVTNEAAD